MCQAICGPTTYMNLRRWGTGDLNHLFQGKSFIGGNHVTSRRVTHSLTHDYTTYLLSCLTHNLFFSLPTLLKIHRKINTIKRKTLSHHDEMWDSAVNYHCLFQYFFYSFSTVFTLITTYCHSLPGTTLTFN